MRTRLTALTLGLYLSFAVLGCNKPAAPPDSSASPSSSDGSSSSAAPSGDAAGSGSAMSNTAMSNMKPEPAKTFGSTRRHGVDGPAGTNGRLQNQFGGTDLHCHPGQPGSGRWQNGDPFRSVSSGTVVDAKPLGRFKGGASLQLRLTSIAIGGAEQSISTSSVVRSEKGKGKRTAVMAGGGAGLGALIGGLAGGGKGAAIGALAGGGAGAGGAAFTGNKDVVLPAESALSFKLEQPLEVK